MADLFGIGLTGLRASQTQLAVTGQNITNVNTPGYSRQSALQATQVPSYTGAGYIGNGTKVVYSDGNTAALAFALASNGVSRLPLTDMARRSISDTAFSSVTRWRKMVNLSKSAIPCA